MDIQFKEEKRNQPHWSGWYSQEADHIDTYFKNNGNWLFLRGIAECAPDYEKREIDSLKKQLIEHKAKYVCFYCHAPIGDGRYAVDFITAPEDDRNPLRFLAWVQEHRLTFEPFSRFQWLKHIQCWEFGGNLVEYSSAFTYRIWDRELAIKVKRAFMESQDPTFADRRNQYLESLTPRGRKCQS